MTPHFARTLSMVAAVTLIVRASSAQSEHIPEGGGGAAAVGASGAAAIGGSLSGAPSLDGALGGSGGPPPSAPILDSRFVPGAAAASATQSLKKMEEEFGVTQVTTKYAGYYLDIYYSPTDQTTEEKARNIIEGELKKLIDKVANALVEQVMAAPAPAGGQAEPFHNDSPEEVKRKRDSLSSQIEEVRSAAYVEADNIAQSYHSVGVQNMTQIRSTTGRAYQGLSGFQQKMAADREASLKEYDTMFHSTFQHPQMGNAFRQLQDLANQKGGFDK